MRKSIPAVVVALLLPAAPINAQEKVAMDVILGQRTLRIQCPMPVAVPEPGAPAERLRDDMPVARPDPAKRHRMLVVRPGCHNPLGPQQPRVKLERLAPPQPKKPSSSIPDLFGGGWLKRQPADTSKRPPGR